MKCTRIDSGRSYHCLIPNLGRVGIIPVKIIKDKVTIFDDFLISKHISFKDRISGLQSFYEINQLQSFVKIFWNDNFENLTLHLIEFDENGRSNEYLIQKTINGNSFLLDETLLITPNPSTFKFLVLILKTKGRIVKATSFVTVNIETSENESKLVFEQKCLSWYNEQPEFSQKYFDLIPPCWPSVPRDNFPNKYPSNFGQFVYDSESESSRTTCYRSNLIVNRMGNYGGQQQCCYNSENNLIVVSPDGGSLKMSNNFKPIQNFLHDVVPYQTCKYAGNTLI